MGSMSQIKRNDFDIWSIEAGAFGLKFCRYWNEDQKQVSVVAITARDALSTSMCFALRAASLWKTAILAVLWTVLKNDPTEKRQQ